MDESSEGVVPQALILVGKDRRLLSEARIAEAGQIANTIAAGQLFADYRRKRAKNTLSRQDDDLALFARYLADANADIQLAASELASEASAWSRITWGLVSGFLRWQERKGYAIGSINVRLATIKVYAGLAVQAGTLTPDTYAAIKLIKGYRLAEGRNVDAERDVTRIGDKKAESNVLDREQASFLKNTHPNTPQGRRDAVLMCLLLDHGLRVGELALLRRQSINMSSQTFILERPKVGKVGKEAEIHQLSTDTLKALRAYFKEDRPTGQLLKGSKQTGELTEGMSVRAIKSRVRYLGRLIGISNLSPHDCRHTWATIAASFHTDVFALQEAGGWSSLDMPRRYVERAKIANAGVKLA